MKPTINKTINNRMLQIMEYAIRVGKVKNKSEWCEKIGVPVQNLTPQIIAGKQTFTHAQIYNAVTMVGGSVEFVYGQSHTIVIKPKNRTVKSLLTEALSLMK